MQDDERVDRPAGSCTRCRGIRRCRGVPSWSATRGRGRRPADGPRRPVTRGRPRVRAGRSSPRRAETGPARWRRRRPAGSQRAAAAGRTPARPRCWPRRTRRGSASCPRPAYAAASMPSGSAYWKRRSPGWRSGRRDAGAGRAAPRMHQHQPADRAGTGSRRSRRTASPQRLAKRAPVDLAIGRQRQRRHAPHQARKRVLRAATRRAPRGRAA